MAKAKRGVKLQSVETEGNVQETVKAITDYAVRRVYALREQFVKEVLKGRDGDKYAVVCFDSDLATIGVMPLQAMRDCETTGPFLTLRYVWDHYPCQQVSFESGGTANNGITLDEVEARHE